MPFLPFPEWRPDVSDYQGASSLTIANVLPRGDGYGPFPDFVPFTAALPAACRGYCFARNADGSIATFAGTATRLYKLDNTGFNWTDVSAGGSPYGALSAAFNWQFVQFNNFVIAVQQNAAPQVFDLTSSSAFAALGGSPPQASYVAVINRFVVLSGLLSFPYRVQWSGLNATTTWDNVTAQSNFQDMADGGLVRGVAGGDTYGIIFQDATIRSMTFAPGSPEVFDILRISTGDGIFAPYSAVNAGGQTFFCSTQGFQAIAPGGTPTPVGKERFDRTFFADVDQGNLQLVIGAADPKSARIYWAYKSLAGAAGQFDKIIVYDWLLGRAAVIAMTGEYLATLAKPGLTLENLDAIDGDIDSFPFSFDNVSTAALAQLSGVGTGHAVGFYAGPNLEAVLETAEQAVAPGRLRVQGLRPITDAVAALGSVTTRETVQAAALTSAEAALNAQGLCPLNLTARYARGRLRIPYGASWSFALGLEPQFVPEGLQ
jgi:hypothetical protein